MLQGSKGSYYNTYLDWTAKEIPRQPEALINATYKRVGNHMEFVVDVTNKLQSGATLNSKNQAAVFVIVYEDMASPLNPNLSLTHRLIRAVTYRDIASLAPNGSLALNESLTVPLSTRDMSGVDWTKLHAVAFVDYRPGEDSGRWDMLQAAMAVPPTVTATPSSLSFTVDAASPVNPAWNVLIGGAPQGADWTLKSKPSWITMPSSGKIGSTIAVSANLSDLIPCKNSGPITISTNDAPVQTIIIPVEVNFTGTALAAAPTSLSFTINPNNPQDLQSTVQLTSAPSAIAWSVSSPPAWSTVTPSSGTTTSLPKIGVIAKSVQSGMTTTGTVKFASPSCPSLASNVPVSVIYPAFAVSPSVKQIMIDPLNVYDPEVTIQTSGYPATNTWTVTNKPQWVTEVTPGSETVGSTFKFKVDHTLLERGDYHDHITLESTYSGITMTRTVDIQLSYNPPYLIYMPLIHKK